jgi:hypothetical protein
MAKYYNNRIYELLISNFNTNKKYFYKIIFGILIIDLKKVFQINVNVDIIDITIFNSNDCKLSVDVYFSILENEFFLLLSRASKFNDLFIKDKDSIKIGGYKELIYCFKDIFLD